MLNYVWVVVVFTVVAAGVGLGFLSLHSRTIRGLVEELRRRRRTA
jgi:heme exporter protein D